MADQQALPVPRSDEVKRYFYENAPLGETRRYRQLDRYEAHYGCRQYAHQGYDWWGMSADQMETVSPDVQVPLGFTQPALNLTVRQRRPTAPYNLCKAVVDRFTGLLFSDVRHPDISIEGDEDTEGFLLAAMESMRFWAKMREARTVGGSVGSSLVTVHLRDGKFCLEVHNPKHCQVVWKDRRSLMPFAVLKCYRYPVMEDILDPRTNEYKGSKQVDYLYRRVITEVDDTVYVPAKLDGEKPSTWEVESEVKHGLGFFPGVWVQNLPVLEQEDGEPDCQGAWQSFDAMDRILAQQNKAVLLNLDPTLCLKLDAKEMAQMGGSVRKGSDNALYLGASGSANYLEITGSGVDAGSKVWAQLKQNTLDVVRCVLVDPQTISGAAQSAKAIEYIYAPMLEKADDLRAQYGDLCVVPLLRVVEKMVRKFAGQTVQIAPGKVGRYKFDLPPKVTQEDQGDGTTKRIVGDHALGLGGYIRLSWGPYFAPTAQDKQAALQALSAAKMGGLIDQETAVKQASLLFDVRDPASMLEKIKAEEQAAMGGGYGADLGGMEAATEDWSTPEAESPLAPASEGKKP